MEDIPEKSPADSPPLAPSRDCAEPGCGAERVFATPPEHRRNRKSWTEEEKEAFWKRKKQEKKMRKKAAVAQRQRDQQAEWEQLSEEEKAQRRQEAAQVFDDRRAREQQHRLLCERNLANSSLPILVFDLSFAWTMTVPDTKSTASQLKLSYSRLRHAGFPMRPVMTSLLGRETDDESHDSADQSATLTSSLVDFAGFKHFPPRMTTREHWSALFPTDKTVFLTADSENVLQSIEPDHVYVIGAFVDHNQHKGLSLRTAQRHGVHTARLPLQESMDLGNRCKVLTVNHVVDALVRYTETHDWSAAFESSLPTRRVRQEEEGSSHHRRAQRRRQREQDHSDGDSRDGCESGARSDDASGDEVDKPTC